MMNLGLICGIRPTRAQLGQRRLNDDDDDDDDDDEGGPQVNGKNSTSTKLVSTSLIMFYLNY